MTETERYLAKARESLASAEEDVAAGRYNSAANRSYYAAFQAAVAALIWSGVRPVEGDWGHRFVMERFSVTLTKRRKLLPASLNRIFDDLFDNRVIADYREADISKRAGRRGAKSAGMVVESVEMTIGQARLREGRVDYGSQIMTTPAAYRKKAVGFIKEIKDTILEAYPDCTFEVIERTPKDYRLIVKGSFEDQLDIQDLLDGRKIDILVEHDVWIVLLAEPVEQAA